MIFIEIIIFCGNIFINFPYSSFLIRTEKISNYKKTQFLSNYGETTHFFPNKEKNSLPNKMYDVNV